MFRKLISNLPFAPQLIEQVQFYTRRLAQEQATRRLAVMFSVAAIGVQVFAIVAPPIASNAASTNDVIYGGLGNNPKQKLVEVYDRDKDSQGRDGIQALFNYFGISRNALVHSQPDNISSARNNLNSVGRNPHSVQDVLFRVAGHRYFLRPLGSWGITSYDALRGERNNGKPFWVLIDCGNIVINTNLPDQREQPPSPQPTPTPTPPTPPTPTPPPTPEQPSPPEQPTTPQQPPPPPNITLAKQATNSTKGIADAHNTQAAAGDILEYRLLTTNTGGQWYEDYVVEENVADILEYADIESISEGGRLNDDGLIIWLAEDIQAGATLTKTFRTRVKNPIPQTPRSSSDLQSFDLRMDNVYGNVISILLPGGVPKVVETVATQLPNTGPGLNLALGIGLAMLVTFFFLRNRQLLVELKILRQALNQGGLPWQNTSSQPTKTNS